MAKLINFNGRFCESDYEFAFISYLETEGWQYLPGNKLAREEIKEVLHADDIKEYLATNNPDLPKDDIEKLFDTIRLVGAESDFATLHKFYNWLIDGIKFTPQDGKPRTIQLIDFERPENNIFRVVNQLTVEYINNGKKENRRPDELNPKSWTV